MQPTDANSKSSGCLSENPKFVVVFLQHRKWLYTQPPFPQALNPLDSEFACPLGHPAITLYLPTWLFLICLPSMCYSWICHRLFMIHLHDGVSSPSLICVFKTHTPYTHKTCTLVAKTQALATLRSSCFWKKDQWYRSVNHDIKC